MVRTVPVSSLLLLLLAAGCGGGGGGAGPVSPPAPPPAPVPVASVIVIPDAPSVMAGASVQLSATPRDASNNPLTGRTVTWTSATEAVATVTTGGLVTGVSAGTAQIRATSEGITGQATVTVTPVPVASVTLSQSSATLVPTQQLTLTATPRDAQGAALGGRSVVWSSSGEPFATVSQSGVVTAVAAGTATITATSEGKSAQAVITVVAGTIVGAAGGNVVGAGGTVTLAIPAGALASPVPITVTALASPPAHARLIPGTAFEFGPDGTQFAQPVTVTIKFTVPNLGTAIPVNLRLHRYTAGAWVQLPGGSVDLGTLSVTGTTSGFSTYALLEVVPPALAFSALAAADYHSCGITTAGAAWCWGAGDEGRLGHGSTSGSPIPVAVAGGHVFTAITVGGRHSCALKANGEAWCWGYGGQGRLGNAGVSNSLVPVQVAGGHAFTAIDAGLDHTCGIQQGGSAWCWGDGIEGRLGNGVANTLSYFSAVPVAVSSAQAFTGISAGGSHSCAVAQSGGVWCWGVRSDGRLGDGTFGTPGNFFSPIPVQVTSVESFSRVSVGRLHACALTLAGAAFCWGANLSGNLGDGTTVNRASPVLVSGAPALASVDAGSSHTCGVTAGPSVVCWGSNASGQLGRGSFGGGPSGPGTVGGGLGFTGVVSGAAHSCARTAAGAAWCWGEGLFGALGYGGGENQPAPVAVAGPALGSLRLP